jgi:hypothetical protein
MYQAKSRTNAASGEAAFDLPHDAGRAERWQVRPEAERHVRRQRSAEDLAFGMRQARV